MSAESGKMYMHFHEIYNPNEPKAWVRAIWGVLIFVICSSLFFYLFTRTGEMIGYDLGFLGLIFGFIISLFIISWCFKILKLNILEKGIYISLNEEEIVVTKGTEKTYLKNKGIKQIGIISGGRKIADELGKIAIIPDLVLMDETPSRKTWFENQLDKEEFFFLEIISDKLCAVKK